MSRFPENIFLTTRTYTIPGLHSIERLASWTILQGKTLPVSFKAQFVTFVTGNSNHNKFFKMIEFRTVPNEVNVILQ